MSNMDRSTYFLVFAIISLGKPCYTSNSNNVVVYNYPDGITGITVKQQQLIQPSLDNIVITSPDYLNPNNQISFAAPVGAQHPNQKPQPEPQPPPYKPTYRQYHDHTVYIDSGYARSYVHYQRTFN
ncbi:uncharacterized protein LOC119075764 [Bradysia coprophila]|uniref:uncharacterized protein LOC119075764 n=1 Tax=Bradysia coprophila TaxID=38358 RepID=UPI00187D99D8|nr:uncharacterized protein LOC119075764 [Bradysia coprophila]